jgi:hypothetical protein
LAGFVLAVALAALIASVFLATRFIVGHWVPPRARRWAWIPIAGVLAVLPFSDEVYNERQTRLACAREGGMVFGKVVPARSTAEGAALIDTVKVDTEERHYWKHEMIFVYRPTGEELALLRWFDRKHGWLQGNEPGTRYARYFPAASCPDPQPYLAGGAARASLIRAAGRTEPAQP